MYDFKKDFPLFKDRDVIYLDNAATAQKPVCVIEAEKEFYEKHNANPLRGFYPLSLEATDAYEAARKTVQQFIHAASETEIIFTRNTTESLNLVAYSYGLNNLCPEDEIVVSIMEHHSNMLPWQMVARQTGAKLIYLECEKDGSLSEAKLDEAFSDKTRLVAITQVSNVLGRPTPVEEIVRRARKSNAVVVLDDMKDEASLAYIGDTLASYSDDYSSLPVIQKTIVAKNDHSEMEVNMLSAENLDVLEDMMNLRTRQGHDKVTLDNSGVIITEKLATMLNLSVGDTISLKITDKFIISSIFLFPPCMHFYHFFLQFVNIIIHIFTNISHF